MTAVSADSARLAIVRETGSPSAPPTTPAWIVARMTGEGITFAPTTTESGELDPSGQVRDQILTGATSTGPINFEVSNHDAFEEYLAAVFGNDWAADELIPATSLFLYTVEKTWQLPGPPAAESYHRFANSAFAELALTITPGEPIRGVATVNGGPFDQQDTAITGSTYPDPGTEAVLTPNNVQVMIGGILGAACLGNTSLTFNNGTRGRQCVGVLGEKDKVRGRFVCTIAAQIYYLNDEPVLALIGRDELAVSVEIKNDAGDTEYLFEFPRCKFMQGVPVAGGTGQDVVIDSQLRALYDATLGYTCKVTRLAAGP